MKALLTHIEAKEYTDNFTDFALIIRFLAKNPEFVKEENSLAQQLEWNLVNQLFVEPNLYLISFYSFELGKLNNEFPVFFKHYFEVLMANQDKIKEQSLDTLA